MYNKIKIKIPKYELELNTLNAIEFFEGLTFKFVNFKILINF